MDLHRPYTNVNVIWDKGRIRKFMGVWELENQIKFSIKYSVNSLINAALEQPKHPQKCIRIGLLIAWNPFSAGGLRPPGPPTRALPWTHWGPRRPQTPCLLCFHIVQALATPLIIMKHATAYTIYCFSFRHYAWYLCGRRSQGLSCVRYCWIYYTNSPSVFSHTLCTYCIYCIYVFMYCLWANGLRNKWTWTWSNITNSYSTLLIHLVTLLVHLVT